MYARRRAVPRVDLLQKLRVQRVDGGVRLVRVQPLLFGTTSWVRHVDEEMPRQDREQITCVEINQCVEQAARRWRGG